MIFVNYIGYRMTGRIFITRTENPNTVKAFKALLENGPDINYHCDIDDQEDKSEIVVVLDTVVDGNAAYSLYSLITQATSNTKRLSTLVIVPRDTMLPSTHYFGRTEVLWDKHRKLSLNHIKTCLPMKQCDLEYVKDVMKALLVDNNTDNLQIAINAIRDDKIKQDEPNAVSAKETHPIDLRKAP